MTFTEAFQHTGFGIGTKATLRGYLIASRYFSYLVESEAADAQSNPQAIMVAWPQLADELQHAGAPGRVGSMVLFCGEAEVTGWLNKTGMGLVEVAIHSVSELTYWHAGKEFKLGGEET